MFKCLCVFSLSQPSSRDLLYVKCLWACCPRYPIPVVEICYMLNVCVVMVILSVMFGPEIIKKCIK